MIDIYQPTQEDSRYSKHHRTTDEMRKDRCNKRDEKPKHTIDIRIIDAIKAADAAKRPERSRNKAADAIRLTIRCSKNEATNDRVNKDEPNDRNNKSDQYNNV